MRILLIAIFVCTSLIGLAQNKTTIVEKGVKMIRTLEQDIAQGEKKMLLEKEEYYDVKGELIELKEFDEKGRIKKWEQYKYSAEGKLVEEKSLNYKGDLDERIVYVFKNGLKVEKLYYDEKNRLYKKKKYEVEFR